MEEKCRYVFKDGDILKFEYFNLDEIEKGVASALISFWGRSKLISRDRWTGLTDKSGEEIYHHDILQMYRHSFDTHQHEKDFISEIYYERGAFYVTDSSNEIKQTFLHMARPGQSFEKIGTIYDPDKKGE